MKAILGRKIGMSQIFSEDGQVVPVTLISVEPNRITLRRNEDRDGHNAVQIGLNRKNFKETEDINEKLTPGRLNKQFEARREFCLELDDKVTEVTVEQFEVGDVVEVVGTSKGKGFQGVVKRHGFKGGPASHGHRHVLRSGGSIGSAYPQHVMKGKKMAGRMGGARVTVKNLEVKYIDIEKKVLALKGAVPGTAGSVVAVVARNTGSK